MFLIDFLEYILEGCYGLTGSYGWAIVLLSLVVMVIMLPLFWIADAIQDIENKRQEALQPSLEEIEDVDNKQERYYYRKEIYRKHGYKSYYALTGLVGLFVQVPFFIAAYYMLLDYEPIKGVSFGPIANLAEPDGLLALGGYTVNVLPFAMTVANLFSGFLYTRGESNSQRGQLAVVAVVFFALLYNLSAALVLYWTMNNIFSIGKNWLLEHFHSERANGFIAAHVGALGQRLTVMNKKYGQYVSLFALAVVPVLYTYYQNIDELAFYQISNALLVMVAVTGVLLIVAGLLFKNKHKVLLAVAALLLGFFLFGYVPGAILLAAKHMGFSLAASSLYSLPGILTMYAGFALAAGTLYLILVRINRGIPEVATATRLLSYLLLVLMLFNITVYTLSGTAEAVTEDSGTKKEQEVPLLGKTSEKSDPDIYYIVFDGYANTKILQDKFDYDNGSFDTALEEKGFIIAKDSRANYMSTFLSLAGTLNMRYPDETIAMIPAGSKDRTLIYDITTNNSVKNSLHERGYVTMNFRSGWGNTDLSEGFDKSYAPAGRVSEFNTNFFHQTLLGPVLNIYLRSAYVANLRYTFDGIGQTEQVAPPKFVFAHIVCPHYPYVFDENGNTVPSSVTLNRTWNTGDLPYYLQQLRFVSKEALRIADEILENSERDVVIIMQSDHGSAFLGNNVWTNPSEGFIQERSKILNAVLYSNGQRPSLPQDISSVNTFRIVFNDIFATDLPLLADSTYYSDYDLPYELRNVTEIVNGE